MLHASFVPQTEKLWLKRLLYGRGAMDPELPGGEEWRGPERSGYSASRPSGSRLDHTSLEGIASVLTGSRVA